LRKSGILHGKLGRTKPIIMDEHLLRFNTDQKFVCFDLETEHLNLATSRPWQFGFTVFNQHTVFETKWKNILWKDLDISDGAAKVTHFNKSEYLRTAIDAEEALGIFDSYLYNPGYRLVGHNVLSFDVFQHNTWRKSLGKPSDFSYMDRVIDTNALAKAISLMEQPDLGDFVSWQYKILNRRVARLKTKLSVVATNYGIPFDENKLHEAEEDVKLNAKVFNKQKFDIEI